MLVFLSGDTYRLKQYVNGSLNSELFMIESFLILKIRTEGNYSSHGLVCSRVVEIDRISSSRMISLYAYDARVAVWMKKFFCFRHFRGSFFFSIIIFGNGTRVSSVSIVSLMITVPSNSGPWIWFYGGWEIGNSVVSQSSPVNMVQQQNRHIN